MSRLKLSRHATGGPGWSSGQRVKAEVVSRAHGSTSLCTSLHGRTRCPASSCAGLFEAGAGWYVGKADVHALGGDVDIEEDRWRKTM
jgi:hypothetical protein